MSGMERIALAHTAIAASALPLADHALTVTWRNEAGALCTAFCDDDAGVPTGCTVAVARDGVIIEMETESIGDVA